jgi:uncharacterized protein YktB (UPF0637 family)
MFAGWSAEHFDIFAVEDFGERMARIRASLQPRLAELGDDLAEGLAIRLGAPFYVHVAKHLRRRVNPPDETWVALGPAPRGYKATPHFEAGLAGSGAFARFVLKPEAQAARRLFVDRVDLATLHATGQAGSVFWFRAEHGQDPIRLRDLSPDDFAALRARGLRRDGAIEVGGWLDRVQATDRDRLVAWTLDMFEQVAPLYVLATPAAVA